LKKTSQTILVNKQAKTPQNIFGQNFDRLKVCQMCFSKL